jgi:hypothetical protein
MKDLTGRAQRLRAADSKVAARLAAIPILHRLSARAARLRAKLEDIRTSLENLNLYGQETPPTGNSAGAKISVPKQGGPN